MKQLLVGISLLFSLMVSAQDQTTEHQFSFKLGLETLKEEDIVYAPDLIETGSKIPELLIETDVTIISNWRIGGYAGYASPRKVISVRYEEIAEGRYIYGATRESTNAFLYGLKASYDIFSFFTKGTTRFSLLTTFSAGWVRQSWINYDSGVSINHSYFEYGPGLSLSFRLFDHMGLFAESSFGQFFNDNHLKFKGGIQWTF